MNVLGLEVSSLVLTRTVSIVIIVIATLVTLRLASKYLRAWLAATGALPTTSIFLNITRIAIIVLGVMFGLAVLDISITPVITALGVGGLAVALALQDTLTNLFSGLQIVATRQIRPGDYVKLEGGQEGMVVDTAWRTTTLRTPLDNLVIIPNGVLAQTIVTNYKLPVSSIAASVEFGVTYDVDLSRVEQVALEVARETMGAAGHDAEAHPPVIRFIAFGESQISCVAWMSVLGYTDQFALKSAFVRRLHERFGEEGIHFPYPVRDVRLVTGPPSA